MNRIDFSKEQDTTQNAGKRFIYQENLFRGNLDKG